ncbi:MAG: DUF2065 domain-containing protein [Aquincola sp.]|nr:DUF2065 domain-containing protein [Aquincola sp.]
MTGETLVNALALLLIAEGLLPLLSPKSWREAFTRLLQLNDGQLRFFGLTAVALGMLLILL